MQTQQLNRPLSATPSPKHTHATASPQPWVKPTFEQIPLNDALSGGSPGHPSDGFGTYTSS